MKNYQIIVILIFLIPCLSGVDAQKNSYQFQISTGEIEIGQRITLIASITGLEDVRVLWQDIRTNPHQMEVLHWEDYYHKNILNLKVEFTFFTPEDYQAVFFTIPLLSKTGKTLYLETKKYNISVKSPLTQEQVKMIKETKNEADINLKAEKVQEKIPFKISLFFMFAGAGLLFVLLIMILFYIFYRKIFRKGHDSKDPLEHLSAYEIFLFRLEKINFTGQEGREKTEEKISLLTEALKELILNTFSLNALTKTTRELIDMLTAQKFNPHLILEIKQLFNQLDLIKFARSRIETEQLEKYCQSIKEIGAEINRLNYIKNEALELNQTQAQTALANNKS